MCLLVANKACDFANHPALIVFWLQKSYVYFWSIFSLNQAISSIFNFSARFGGRPRAGGRPTILEHCFFKLERCWEHFGGVSAKSEQMCILVSKCAVTCLLLCHFRQLPEGRWLAEHLGKLVFSNLKGAGNILVEFQPNLSKCAF